MYRKVPWKSNESDVNLKPDYHWVFVVVSILAERCMYTNGENSEIMQIWALNQANQNDWRRKTRELTHKSNLNCPEGVTQSLSSLCSLRAYPCVYPLVWYSFSSNKYLTCFTTFHLHGNCLLQS